jgi:hypothetical protein
MHAFDAVDGSSHRHHERLLAVPSGLIERHDGVGVPRAARREAIEEYVHGVGIDLGRTSAKARQWPAARRPRGRWERSACPLGPAHARPQKLGLHRS